MNAIAFLDTHIESLITHIRGDKIDTLFYYITMLGSVEVAVLSCCVCVWWALTHHEWRNHAFTFLLAATGTVAVKEALKMIIARPRPEAITLAHGLEHGFSFPSGHATFITAAMTVLAYTLSKRFQKPAHTVLLYVGAATIALLVAYSRLHLRVHYASDVFAGMLLGYVGACISIHLIIKKHAS